MAVVVRSANNTTPTFLTVTISQPRGVTTLVGNSAALTVFASGTPPLSYQWRFNGAALADDRRIIGSQSNPLVITNVLLSDAGGYQVIVTNAYGSATSAVAVLVVNQVPGILAQPTNQTPCNRPGAEGGACRDFGWATINSRHMPDVPDASDGGFCEARDRLS